MRDNIGLILALLGVITTSLGFIIGAFMLHWILGLIVTGIALIVLGAIIVSDKYEWEDWEDF